MCSERSHRLCRVAEQLDEIYSPSCNLCELRCGVDRERGERGLCGLADEVFVYRRLLHLGEERPLVPSYAVWLAGCNFSCSSCSDAHALRTPFPGRLTGPRELAEAIARDLGESKRPIRNINFVGGEPSISLPFIAKTALELLEMLPSMPPLLLNTNCFLSAEALEAAIGLFDLFLVDLKFGNDDCAEACGAPPRYIDVLSRNLARLAETDRQIWVRHLLMPRHIACCAAKVISMLEDQSHRFHVNVMPAFVDFEGNCGSLARAEVERAQQLLATSRIENRYWDGKPLRHRVDDSYDGSVDGHEPRLKT